MKKIKIFIPVLFVLFLFSFGCRKLDKIDSLNGFNVTADKASYNIGDTAVFSISSNADVILYYSGEPGYNVNYRNRNFVDSGINILKFQTQVMQSYSASKGDTTPLQNFGDTIFLKISTNLKSYDSTGIANATWSDITPLALWPTPTTVGYVYSGAIDISQYRNAPAVYIAFQVLGYQHAATQTEQRKWLIQNFTLSNTSLPDSSYTPLFYPAYTTVPNQAKDTLPNFLNVGWAQVNMNLSSFLNPQPTKDFYDTHYGAWNVGDYGFTYYTAPLGYNGSSVKPWNTSGVFLTNSYPITFDPGTQNTDNNNGWLVTSPVNLKLVRHDFPTAELKDQLQTPAKGFKYMGAGGVFATYRVIIDSTFVSGKTYDMGFVAQNRNINQSNEVVRHVMVKIN